MNTFLEILKYTLPSVVVFLTAYYILKTYFDHKIKLENLELRKKDHEIILPLRLQAYERMVLLLERISPNQVVFRVKKPEMNPAQFQSALIQSIREEFEHNVAQQIYISPEAWSLVKNSREEIIRLINTAFISMEDKATGNDLAKKILEEWSNLQVNPVNATVDFLKNEVGEMF